ncbi:MAG: hypothetical protein Q7T69_08295 [Rhodoferax sp.]|nr:hypothetical protein [Rhodoferax sp.]
MVLNGESGNGSSLVILRFLIANFVIRELNEASTSYFIPVTRIPTVYCIEGQEMKQRNRIDLHRGPIVGSALKLLGILLFGFLALPSSALAAEFDSSIGVYVGKYYDSEPAGWTQGRANYLEQHMVALTASKTIWRSQSLPMSLEIDGMIGQQFGVDSLTEIAVVPVLRWSSFPWKDTLQTDLRLGPLGVSYTSSISSLERGPSGKGSQTLGFLIIELAVSRPSNKADEFFMRLHHRCAVYDRINDYGANGEDYFSLGYRHRF